MKGATPNTQITLVKEDKKVIKQPKMIGPYVSLKKYDKNFSKLEK